MTELDRLHAAMAAGGEAEGLAFWRGLAEAELFLLLEAEAEGETLLPRHFDTEEGRLILAFDSEERLAGLDPAPLPYAALPGRVVARLLSEQGLGLGLNLGTGADSETILPAEALAWLIDMLDQAAPEAMTARIAAVSAPTVPEAVMVGLAQALGGFGKEVGAWLAGVGYADGRRGQLLAVTGLEPADEPRLARAVTEALAFSGIEAGYLDLAFLAPGDALLARLPGAALSLETVRAPALSPATPRAPGSDPDRPPILR